MRVVRSSLAERYWIMSDDKLREAVDLTWKALEADDSETEFSPVGVKWLLDLNYAVAHLRAALADSAKYVQAEDMDTWVCNGCRCSWHVWKGQPNLTRCPNCKGRDTEMISSAPPKRTPEETRGEHEIGFCWCGAHHDVPPPEVSQPLKGGPL